MSDPEGSMSRFMKLPILIGAGAILAATGARAQDDPDPLRGCYVPPTGLVYVIGEAGAPSECLDERHIGFSWARQTGPIAGPAPGTTVALQQGGGPSAVVPSGAVAHFSSDVCPTGWTEFGEAQGRALVGLPDGGAANGSVGPALANLETRTHQHAVADAELGTAGGGLHEHGWAEGAGTDPAGAHNHRWAAFSNANIKENCSIFLPFRCTDDDDIQDEDWFTHLEDGRSRRLLRWFNGIDSEGTGIFPLSFANAKGFFQLYTERSDPHSHEILTDGVTVGEAGAHQHTLAVPARDASAAATAEVMPYLQLLACRKD